MKLKLKVLWLEDSIGIALAQSNYNDETINLTPYYFWPKNDAWEQLQFELSSKEWISSSYRITTLNKISEIMARWKQQKKFKTTSATISENIPIILSGCS